MTIDYRLKDCRYLRNDNTPYKSLYDEEEFDRMLALCKRVFKKDYTNGKTVRLDNCTDEDNKTILSLSRVGFFDFITSNFALFNIDKLLKEADDPDCKLVSRLYERYCQDGPFDSLDRLLSRGYLANTLAVSCLFTDRRGRILMTKRNSNVGISNDFYSTTVTGSVDATDLESEDPLKECCIRETAEELSFIISAESISLHTIAVGTKKRQPIALADVLVDDIDDVVCELRNSEGFLDENSNYCITDQEGLAVFLANKNAMITEAARTHLEGALKG